MTIDQLTGNIGKLSKCQPESWAPHFGLTATGSGLEFMSWLLEHVPAPVVNALRYIGGLGEHKFQMLEFDKVSTPSIGRLVFDTLEDSEPGEATTSHPFTSAVSNSLQDSDLPRREMTKDEFMDSLGQICNFDDEDHQSWFRYTDPEKLKGLSPRQLESGVDRYLKDHPEHTGYIRDCIEEWHDADSTETYLERFPICYKSEFAVAGRPLDRGAQFSLSVGNLEYTDDSL